MDPKTIRTIILTAAIVMAMVGGVTMWHAQAGWPTILLSLMFVTGTMTLLMYACVRAMR